MPCRPTPTHPPLRCNFALRRHIPHPPPPPPPPAGPAGPIRPASRLQPGPCSSAPTAETLVGVDENSNLIAVGRTVRIRRQYLPILRPSTTNSYFVAYLPAAAPSSEPQLQPWPGTFPKVPSRFSRCPREVPPTDSVLEVVATSLAPSPSRSTCITRMVITRDYLARRQSGRPLT